jgi:hypothetical protein
MAGLHKPGARQLSVCLARCVINVKVAAALNVQAE